MKRMSPEAYQSEAHWRVVKATSDLVARFGTWNAKKIKEEIERELRNIRLGRTDDDRT